MTQPMARFELATPCLQGRCNNHYATSAYCVNNIFILYMQFVYVNNMHNKPQELTHSYGERMSI